MKKLFLSFLMMLTLLPLAAANKYDNPDTIGSISRWYRRIPHHRRSHRSMSRFHGLQQGNLR